MKAVISVKGMKCGGCEANVQDAVRQCDGVIAVKASHRENTVEVEFDDGMVSLDQIRQAIAAKGFELA